MEISKMGLTILKHLRNKDKSYILKTRESNSKATLNSMCHFNEIKELFPKSSYARVIFEMRSLLENKIITVNLPKDPYTFPDNIEDPHIKFGLTGNGHALLENRWYRLMSKYVPLSISVLSVLIALCTLFFNLYYK